MDFACVITENAITFAEEKGNSMLINFFRRLKSKIKSTDRISISVFSMQRRTQNAPLNWKNGKIEWRFQFAIRVQLFWRLFSNSIAFSLQRSFRNFKFKFFFSRNSKSLFYANINYGYLWRYPSDDFLALQNIWWCHELLKIHTNPDNDTSLLTDELLVSWSRAHHHVFNNFFLYSMLFR